MGPPVRQLAARKIPKRVIALLCRTLAVDPAQRPGSPRELLGALESCRSQLASPNKSTLVRWTALLCGTAILAAALFALRAYRKEFAPATALEKSIAVLPFDNRSDAKGSAYFADGIQGDVLTSLVKIKELKVISRSSVMGYRDTTKRNLREIGRQLGVVHVLEGDVQRVANRVVMHVNLTDTRDGRAVWSERYDRTLADSLGLQGELATEVAVALRAKLAPEEKTRLSERPTNNPEAYVLYLQALAHERAAAGKEDIIRADQLYTEAIALDPSFALAHARASIVNSLMYHFVGDFPHDPTLKLKARAEAGEALRLAPTLGEAHLALGHYFYRGEQDYTAALREFSVAATALPNDPEVLEFRAWIYRRQNRWREALVTLARAQELDPRSPLYDLPKTYLMVRDWPAADASLHRVLEIQPGSTFAFTSLAALEVLRKGDPAAGSQIMEKVSTIGPGETLERWDLRMLARDFAAAEKILDGYAAEEFPTQGPKAFYQARTALARGAVALAQPLFAKAAAFYEKKVRDEPDVAGYHAALGLVYAYLGQTADALREGRRAVEMVPEGKDALQGPALADNLAVIYARIGKANDAIDLIERLLTTPGAAGPLADITLAELRLRSEWDPLRSNPRFQKILAGPEPRTIY